MATHVIEINQDLKCSRCGKGGAIKDQRDGLCMSCINKDMTKNRISSDILQEIAADIEKLLIEKQEQIEWAFKRVPDGFKISIGINLDHTVPPTAEYSVSFPLEPARDPVQKETVKLRKVIGQAELDV
ncbi:MAG TPA: hypothetical protein PLT30_16060 [Deltaproteobacteria bacterium]|jgi:hypothetical protein|nr:hypothetical protein [Deltaproteobacteria bacterium]